MKKLGELVALVTLVLSISFASGSIKACEPSLIKSTSARGADTAMTWQNLVVDYVSSTRGWESDEY